MNNKKNIIIIVLTLIIVILIVFIFVLMKRNSDYVKQNNQKEGLVSEETSREQENKEGDFNLEMIKNGYVKMLTGEVSEVNNDAKNFIIDIDPLGKHKKFTIHTNEKTEFSILTHTSKESADEDISKHNDEMDISEEYSPADFSNITELSNVTVTLSEWAENVNDDSQPLVAEKIYIIIE